MPFDIKKFFSGFNIFNGQSLGKIIFFSIIACFVVAVALGVYHKITTPTQRSNYVVKPGGSMQVTNYYATNETESKRNKFIPHFFGEGYVFDEVSSNSNRNGVGGKAGLRWDF